MNPFLALRYRPGLMYCNWTIRKEFGIGNLLNAELGMRNAEWLAWGMAQRA